jgi:acetate kinase
MIILVLNCGSSSVKYALYDWDGNSCLAHGNEERLGESGRPETHLVAVKSILDSLVSGESKVIDSIKSINAVGHRVVHGGDQFSRSVQIDDKVLQSIKDVADLAPLHNPPNIVGIEAAMAALPNVPQVAVFDTAFHQTIPAKAYTYPVPYKWQTEYGVRKYGFHGSSHLYVSKRAAQFLRIPSNKLNVITLHIGNGVSFSAIKNGECIDTSMGLTPLEGAMMGTRSGDIDPAIITFMCDKLKLSAAEVTTLLNKKSGHLGVTEKYLDRRDIEKAMHEGDKRAALSLAMEAYRIKKYIGSYMAVLGRVDAIVFTAGVGENNSYIRRESLSHMDALGIILNDEVNKSTRVSSGETLLSTDESLVKVLVIPTDEEAVLVEDVVAILEGTYSEHQSYTYRFESSFT